MAAHIKNMTEGRPGGLIFTFALPLMLGNVFQQLYTVVDTMVVGKYLGVDALATSLVIAAVMLVFGRAILGCFISGDPAEVEQATQSAYTYLSIMSLFLPVLYLLHVVRSAIQGMGDTALPMASGIVEFIMRTSSAFLLPLIVGPTGIFFAEVSAWTGADLVLIPSYFFVARKKLRPLEGG